MPLLAICGVLQLRFSQNLLVIGLIYLAVADIFVRASQDLPEQTRWKGPALAAMVLCAAGILVNWHRSAFSAGGTDGPLVKTTLRIDPLRTTLEQLMPPESLLATNDAGVLNSYYWLYSASRAVVQLPSNVKRAEAIISNRRPAVVVLATRDPAGQQLRDALMQSGAYADASPGPPSPKTLVVLRAAASASLTQQQGSGPTQP